MSTLTPERPPAAAASGFLPVSPCTPACLPAPDAARGRWAALWRALRTTRRVVLLGLVLGAGAVTAPAAPLLGERALGWIQSRWAALLLASAGVRLVRRGPVPPVGSLLVANHVSWIDVLALAAATRHAPMHMLAKEEVRTWPLIGAMAARAGTLFLDRERLRALPDAVATVAAALRSGGCIGVFAEGTTRCGRSRGDFRPAAFQAALDAGAPVVPVGLSYARRDGSGGVRAAFVGDDTLVSSLARIVADRRTVLELRVGAPLVATASGAGAGSAAPRRALARRCAAAVDELLGPDVAERIRGRAAGSAARRSGRLAGLPGGLPGGRRGPQRRSMQRGGPPRPVEAAPVRAAGQGGRGAA